MKILLLVAAFFTVSAAHAVCIRTGADEEFWCTPNEDHYQHIQKRQQCEGSGGIYVRGTDRCCVILPAGYGQALTCNNCWKASSCFAPIIGDPPKDD